ncbi:isoleucine--tRNA ligase [Candidatus Formimonas warabiya]|uniref:Isoleucine--tRNA ligase n=1 Tax=Formimonas warabiya TaxID=1761012 RepID=A0A3G1KR56_FORW1|nr:isoleucine--tRNA ligase [Candidatus Formimonas warabiya]ATW24944.1 isoleucine--tRNA ligase [Candidatus Formimonas warabiya]
MDYSQTLNLPQTEFPMRGNLPQREPEFLKFWEEIDLYKQVQQETAGKPKFILHDGPPYANGDIHLGHTLNKVLKDIIVKFKSMDGFDAPYIPGWDTHGLPIEQRAIKDLGLNRHKVSTVEFRQKCADYALKYVNIQREQFKRLGVRGDWEHPYLTLAPEYEAIQIGVFGEMAKKGYIYKGLKPVYWCADCETALAEAEVEYADAKSPSIYVKFPVQDGKGILDPDCYFVIWTTTPWTIPANVAICLHPDFTYVLADVEGQKLVVAKELLEPFLKDIEKQHAAILKEFKGSDLEYIVCRHPIMDRDSLIILGEHVTLEAGTGCVHTAPGHGAEDFEVGRKYKLPVISPLDDRGVFTAEGAQFQGMKTGDANKAVVKELDEKGVLLKLISIRHQYPHCWRCKNPILFRATEQWFASIDGFRELALKEIDQVQWIPSWGRDRIYNMIHDRNDWCISRQRTWGVPIPIFYCLECGHPVINDATISHIQALFREHGSQIWFAKEAQDLIPQGLKCDQCGHHAFRKETDIMDVWFDSGSSHAAVLDTRADHRWPADLYLEGSDQHRGWFNSSLSTAVATKGHAPYRTVLTHGFVVDEQGRKQSKSLGNVVDPLKVIEQMGADVMRLWVASADYRSDLANSSSIMKQVSEAYRKIRNTARFLLSNLYDFDPAKDKVAYEDLRELDQWALHKLHKLIERVTNGYRNYEFHIVYHAIHKFCVVDMSAFYLDIVKDRVYTSPAQDLGRRAAQTVMYETIHALVRLITPVLAFTSEEIWRYLPKEGDAPVSVQMVQMPEVNQSYINGPLEEKWDRILAIREKVSKELEIARQQKVIGHSLNAAVALYPDQEIYDFLKPVEDQLSTIFIVSSTGLYAPGEKVPEEANKAEDMPLFIQVSGAPGEKCERCWTYSETVGADGEHPTLCQRCLDVVKDL